MKDATYSRRDLTIAEGAGRVLEALRLFGIPPEKIVISTNLELRLDGFPRLRQRQVEDVGVAVYWLPRKQTVHRVMAIDRYTTVADNLAAVAATLEAMRAIDRHGGAVILERAFTGFMALPSPNDWRHVMGFEETPEWATVQKRYKVLAKQRHPDAGGSTEAMGELNRAFEDARRELE